MKDQVPAKNHNSPNFLPYGRLKVLTIENKWSSTSKYCHNISIYQKRQMKRKRFWCAEINLMRNHIYQGTLLDNAF